MEKAIRGSRDKELCYGGYYYVNFMCFVSHVVDSCLQTVNNSYKVVIVVPSSGHSLTALAAIYCTRTSKENITYFTSLFTFPSKLRLESSVTCGL